MSSAKFSASTPGGGTSTATAADLTPLHIPGLSGWWKADAITGLADGDAVASWSDSSPAALALTQATAGSRPTYQTNELNSLPVVRFDAVDDVLATSTPAVTLAGDWTMFLVHKMGAGTGGPSTPFYNGVPGTNGWGIADRGSTAFKALRVANTTTVSTVAADTAWGIYCARGNGRTHELWVNGGIRVAAPVATPVTPTVSTMLGKASTVTNGGDVFEAIIFNRTLSTIELDMVGRYLAKRTALTWTPIAGPVSKLGPLLVMEGDSQTASTNGTSGTNLTEHVAALLRTVRVVNVGTGGHTINTMAGQSDWQIDALRSDRAPSILTFWAGTNDLYGGDTGATAYADYVSFATNRRNNGFAVIAFTILPRSDAGTPGGYETERQTFNTLIRASWRQYADALVDVAADTAIGDAGDEANTTYYHTDLVHLNNTGRARVAALIDTAIRTLGYT